MRRLLKLLLLLLLLTAGGRAARASHIVGGHLGLTALGNHEYDLTATLYFDQLNAAPGVRESDSLITLAIYERGAGRAAGWLDTFQLWRSSWQQVPYVGGVCQSNRLVTLEFRYQRVIFLDPARYTSPQGYYVVWQRCCRNNITTNLPLASQLPLQAQAQTLYLEFPAPAPRNSAAVVNSSPGEFKALGSYLCLGQATRIPFGGRDPDGDSLVYDLVTPLAFDSVSFVGVRPDVPSPAPYLPVTWNPGYDSLHQITGPQPLTVNPRTGELLLTPGQLGLFAFAVRVTEFRRGVRLGELRREFQALVVNCQPNRPPRLVLTAPGPPATAPRLPRRATLMLPTPGTAGEHCLNVYVTDPDTLSELTLRIVPLYGLPQLPTLDSAQGVVRAPGAPDTLRLRLCLPACAGNGAGGRAALLLIVEDVGCPRALPDTVWLTILTPPLPPAARPTIEALPARYAVTVRAGQTLTLAIRGQVPQPDQNVTVEPLNLTSAPLRAFPIVCFPRNARGTATIDLTWPVACTVPPGEYALRFRASFYDGPCFILRNADTVVRVTVVPPERAQAPRLRVTPTSTDGEPGQTLRLTIRGFDADSDAVSVLATNLDRLPLSRFTALRCPPAAGQGLATTDLTWPIDCTVPPGEYAVGLRVTTLASTCAPASQTDTTVLLRVRPAAATEAQVPNIFSPNADGRNDFFAPVPADFCRTTLFRRLRIFDRWGALRYETTALPAHWDGHLAGAGTYYYLVEYADQQTRKGWLELVR